MILGFHGGSGYWVMICSELMYSWRFDNLIIYPLVTNSLKHSPALRVNSSSVRQRNPLVLSNPEFQFLYQNSPPTDLIPSHISPIHAFQILFLEDPFKYNPPVYTQVFQVVSFPQVSPPKHCTHLFCPEYTPHVTHLILLDFIPRIFGEYRS